MDVAGDLLNIAALMHGDVDEGYIILLVSIDLLQHAAHQGHPILESSVAEPISR